MENGKNSTEIYQTDDSLVTFHISYSSKNFSTGILLLKPGVILPKHNRPNAVENLTQIAGKCLMKLFDENNKPIDYEVDPGEGIRMPKGQYHIHSNPYHENSITLWMAEGDITGIIENIRNMNKKIISNLPKNL